MFCPQFGFSISADVGNPPHLYWVDPFSIAAQAPLGFHWDYIGTALELHWDSTGTTGALLGLLGLYLDSEQSDQSPIGQVGDCKVQHQTEWRYHRLASKTEMLKMGLSVQAGQHCQTETMSYWREIYQV